MYETPARGGFHLVNPKYFPFLCKISFPSKGKKELFGRTKLSLFSLNTSYKFQHEKHLFWRKWEVKLSIFFQCSPECSKIQFFLF
jgi:hypothetical protein